MAGSMTESAGESDRAIITSTIAALETLIADARRALKGECPFGPAQVQAFSARLQSMASIVTYADLLRQLQTTLEQIHIMLLTQHAQMEQRQLQLHCINQWASALRQTQ
jgi:hypothetical protein